MKSFLFTFAVSVLLATSAFVIPNPDRSNIETEMFVPPQPIVTVAPEISERHAGRVIKVSLTIDSMGRPKSIRVMNTMKEMLINQITRAVSQWEFTPATRDGVAIETRVVLPLED
tara:strand:- start:75 stop:419 length:345 start_codon:yes stop_codon:yes gene_type:complete